MGPVITLLGRNVGSIEEVIKNNMLIPLAARFIPPEDTNTIVSHFIDGHRGGLASKVGMAGQSSGWSKHRLLRCVQCLKEDIGACGTPFWRRDHLLPGILFCGAHEMPLSLPCELCADYHNNLSRTLHAGHHCGCGLTPLEEATRVTDKQAEVEIELARITSSLLDADYLPNLDVQRVAFETQNAAARLGLLRDGVVRRAELREFLMESPWNPLFKRTGILDSSLCKVPDALRGQKTFRHPIPAISMLTSLAGEWRTVVDRMNIPSVTTAGLPTLNATVENVNLELPPTLPPTRIAAVYERYRRRRAEHPQRNHTELRRTFPVDAQRYLSKELLVRAGVDIPPSPSKAQIRDSSHIQSLIAHIEQRSRQLREAKYPHRIFAVTLMNTFHRPRIFSQKGMAERLGPAHEVLQQHTETHVQWLERIKATEALEKADRRRDAHRATTAPGTKDAADQEN